MKFASFFVPFLVLATAVGFVFKNNSYQKIENDIKEKTQAYCDASFEASAFLNMISWFENIDRQYKVSLVPDDIRLHNLQSEPTNALEKHLRFRIVYSEFMELVRKSSQAQENGGNFEFEMMVDFTQKTNALIDGIGLLTEAVDENHDLAIVDCHIAWMFAQAFGGISAETIEGVWGKKNLESLQKADGMSDKNKAVVTKFFDSSRRLVEAVELHLKSTESRFKKLESALNQDRPPALALLSEPSLQDIIGPNVFGRNLEPIEKLKIQNRLARSNDPIAAMYACKWSTQTLETERIAVLNAIRNFEKRDKPTINELKPIAMETATIAERLANDNLELFAVVARFHTVHGDRDKAQKLYEIGASKGDMESQYGAALANWSEYASTREAKYLDATISHLQTLVDRGESVAARYLGEALFLKEDFKALDRLVQSPVLERRPELIFKIADFGYRSVYWFEKPKQKIARDIMEWARVSAQRCKEADMEKATTDWLQMTDPEYLEELAEQEFIEHIRSKDAVWRQHFEVWAATHQEQFEHRLWRQGR